MPTLRMSALRSFVLLMGSRPILGGCRHSLSASGSRDCMAQYGRQAGQHTLLIYSWQ